jgi:hypothetical protein
LASLYERAKGGDDNDSEWGYAMTELMKENQTCFEVPDNAERAELFVEAYHEDHFHVICFQVGVLALEYYIKNRDYDKAAKLSKSIVKTVRVLGQDSEFFECFLDGLGCTRKEIVEKDDYSEIFELDFCESDDPKRYRFTMKVLGDLISQF